MAIVFRAALRSPLGSATQHEKTTATHELANLPQTLPSHVAYRFLYHMCVAVGPEPLGMVNICHSCAKAGTLAPHSLHGEDSWVIVVTTKFGPHVLHVCHARRTVAAQLLQCALKQPSAASL